MVIKRQASFLFFKGKRCSTSPSKRTRLFEVLCIRNAKNLYQIICKRCVVTRETSNLPKVWLQVSVRVSYQTVTEASETQTLVLWIIRKRSYIPLKLNSATLNKDNCRVAFIHFVPKVGPQVQAGNTETDSFFCDFNLSPSSQQEIVSYWSPSSKKPLIRWKKEGERLALTS